MCESITRVKLAGLLSSLILHSPSGPLYTTPGLSCCCTAANSHTFAGDAPSAPPSGLSCCCTCILKHNCAGVSCRGCRNVRKEPHRLNQQSAEASASTLRPCCPSPLFIDTNILQSSPPLISRAPSALPAGQSCCCSAAAPSACLPVARSCQHPHQSACSSVRKYSEQHELAWHQLC